MIESIRLKNFRRHEDLCLKFNEKFNLIHGRNNAGKSTIFYGIEYCLFGNVQGFKKISQLASFKTKVVGVELVFRNKNGERFKLQRMHELKGKTRSAKGFYTLKKIHEDNESYLLSSDFGDREEDLSFKVKELIGISKRYFQMGIHFYQGTVPEILSGSKKLDIVFGITAATTLADTFKTRALEFEKELKNVDTLRITLEQSKKEKTDQEKKLESQQQKLQEIQQEVQDKQKNLESFQKFRKSTDTISKSVESYENAKRSVEDMKLREDVMTKEFQESNNKYGTKESLKKKLTFIKKKLTETKNKQTSVESNSENALKEIRDLEKGKIETENAINQQLEISSELKDLIKEVGQKLDVVKKLETKTNGLKTISKKILTLEKESEDILDFLRNGEREKGDIDGILKRREQSKSKPNCEYCGAPIDSSKIAEEMKTLKEKLKKIQDQLKSNEDKEEKVKNELKSLRDEEKNLNDEITDVKAFFQRIESLEERKAKVSSEVDLDERLRLIGASIQEKEKILEIEKKQLKELRDKEVEIEAELHDIEMQLNRLEEYETKLKKFESEIKAAENSLKTKHESLVNTFNQAKQAIEGKIKEISASEGQESQKSFIDALTLIAEKMNIDAGTISLESMVKIRDELKELVITKISEINTVLSHLNSGQDEIKRNIEEIKKQIIKLDKQIAKIEKEMLILKKKKDLADKYRNFQHVFGEVQNIIRKNASKLLEKQIMELHRKLSSDDEFEAVIIDIENYSLSIVPKGMALDEFYPAMVYQGGGHKLILGLAYKIALGSLIGNSPFLLIDEPTEFMDDENRVSLLSNIDSISEKTQVLLITHQNIEKINCKNKIKVEK